VGEYDKVLCNNSAISFVKGGNIAGLKVLTFLKEIFKRVLVIFSDL
jgi:hypothetical protein